MEELDLEEDLVDLEDLNEVWNEEWTQLRNKLRAKEFIEENNVIRKKCNKIWKVNFYLYLFNMQGGQNR